MKLLIFSDIHNNWKTLEGLLGVDADFYVSAGDLVSWGKGLDRAGQILQARGKKVWVLPGNHETARQIAALCDEYGLNYFHERHFQAGRHIVAGLGYSNPTPFDTPGEYGETELRDRLQPFAALHPLVLVCHAPPRDTALDQIRPGLNAGSAAVREFIERHQPGHFFCGHIHEAEGAVAHMGATRAQNVGKKGYLLELE